MVFACKLTLLILLVCVSANGALIDKIENTEISAHNFFAALRLWFNGDITRSQVISAPLWENPATGAREGLEASDEPQLDEIKAKFDSLTLMDDKQNFVLKLEGIGILLQEGIINQAQAKNLFGMN